MAEPIVELIDELIAEKNTLSHSRRPVDHCLMMKT